MQKYGNVSIFCVCRGVSKFPSSSSFFSSTGPYLSALNDLSSCSCTTCGEISPCGEIDAVEGVALAIEKVGARAASWPPLEKPEFAKKGCIDAMSTEKH